jgi:hypothetical protein
MRFPPLILVVNKHETEIMNHDNYYGQMKHYSAKPSAQVH